MGGCLLRGYPRVSCGGGRARLQEPSGEELPLLLGRFRSGGAARQNHERCDALYLVGLLRSSLDCDWGVDELRDMKRRMVDKYFDKQPTQLRAARRPATRPSRHGVAQRCRGDLASHREDILAQFLPGLEQTIRHALMTVCGTQGQATQRMPTCVELGGALAGVGLVVKSTADSVNGFSDEPRVQVEPALLRRAYPKLLPGPWHSFTLHLMGEPLSDRAHGPEVDDFRSWRERYPGSRYPSGVSEKDEIRMQTEVLRQKLPASNTSIDEALDELCAGPQQPSEEVAAHCNRLALALENTGLRFHAVRKSWRLPRSGVLLIDRPLVLERAYPSLAFFEPHHFRDVPIVDRPERAGNEVAQGLLF